MTTIIAMGCLGLAVAVGAGGMTSTNPTSRILGLTLAAAIAWGGVYLALVLGARQ